MNVASLLLACLLSQNSVDPPIVAIVGDDIITRDELEKRLDWEIYKRVEGQGGLLERERPRLLRQILEEMINQRVMVQEVRRKAGGAQVIPDLILDEQLERRVNEMPGVTSVEDYYQRITDLVGMTKEETREAFREELMVIKLLLEEVYPRHEKFVSPDEAKHYYRIHADEFTEPEEISYREIYLRDSRVVHLVIQKIQEGIKNKVPFVKLAQEYSEDFSETAERGRLIKKTFKEVEQYLPPIRNALKTLKKGEIGGPIISGRSVHYLKLEDRKEGNPQRFEEVQEEIKDRIRYERKLLLERKFLEKLKRTTSVETFLPPLPGERNPPPAKAEGNKKAKDAKPKGDIPGEGENKKSP